MNFSTRSYEVKSRIAATSIELPWALFQVVRNPHRANIKPRPDVLVAIDFGRHFLQVLAWATSQVDYVLGKNNLGLSYMVGFGTNFPTRVHHRGSSLPVTPVYGCEEGLQFLQTSAPNP